VIRERYTVGITLALFVVALFLLHHALRDVHYHDIILALRALPASHILLALVCTAGGYLALTAYDTLGVRYVGHPLPYERTAFTAFIGYAFSQTLGITLLSGGPAARLYWRGLSTSEIAGVIAFAGPRSGSDSRARRRRVPGRPAGIPHELYVPITTARPRSASCCSRCSPRTSSRARTAAPSASRVGIAPPPI
jgi:phosphatidylglycerol lysyltransferase